MKKAFTMIELIFVIVILGVVASVATRMIAKTYTSYNNVNTLHKANIKVETAINNIAKRLSYAVPGTIVKRQSGKDINISAIEASPPSYTVLEWIGSDVDGFNSDTNTTGHLQPGWSGYCNLDQSSKNNVITYGSNLVTEGAIVKNLTNGGINNNLVNAGLFFKGGYNYTNVGYSGLPILDNSGVAIVKKYQLVNPPNNGEYNITLQALNPANTPRILSERYKLAYSAYAVVPSDDGTNKPCSKYLNTAANACNANNPCNLCLVYNFRPWVGPNNDYRNVNKREVSLLTSNVSVFKTYSTQNRVHIKICVKENYGVGNKTTSICKEKVVFR